LVPTLSIFALNANFQLIETAFAPAASHALGWGPVQTSFLLGSVSIVIFINMMVVFQLSARKVSNEALLVFGLIVSITGYTSVFFLWQMNAKVWHFAVPMIIGITSFPYLGAPSRSIFTKQVDSDHVLDSYHGTMQALLSMAASVAGFIAPSFVAYYCLRHPEQVEASSDGRELSAWSLIGPFLSILTLLGMIYIRFKKKTEEKQVAIDVEDATKEIPQEPSTPIDEKLGLLANKLETQQVKRPNRRRTFNARAQSNRHLSASIMGISQTTLIEETEKEFPRSKRMSYPF